MSEYTPQVNFVSRTGAGIAGGVAGGVLLGLVLMILGRLKPYAQLVSETDLSTGWVMVLVVGGASGGLFGALLGRYIRGQIVPASGVGLVWGMITWVLLAQLLLPIFGDGGVFGIKESGGIVVLGTYVAFGVATALVYALAGPRRRYYYRRSSYRDMVMVPLRRRTARRRSRR